jgi:hypothetical protein
LYSPVTIRVVKSRRKRWAGNIARGREMKNAYKVLVAKTERKRPFGCSDMEWIHLAQNKDQWRSIFNTAMNLRVP